MKKSLTALLSSVLLFGLAASAQAFSYIVDMAGAQSTPLTSLPGVATSTGALFYTTFAPAPAYEYSTPSVLSFGLFTTVPTLPGDNQAGTFDVDTDFYFYVGRSNGLGSYLFGPDLVHAFAHLTGTVALSEDGVPSSTATFTGGGGEVVSGPNAGVVSFVSIDPNNGEAAGELDLLYGSTPVKLWIDRIASIPAPTAGPISVSGYITDQPSVVPEPGGIGLLLSLVCTTILLVFRRR